MKLILVRHGAAIERGEGVTEFNRYLTPEGRAFFRTTARTMRDQGMAPDLIITSPLVRAVQTADILAETLAYDGPLLAEDLLAPGCSLAAIMPLLDRYRDASELVLVGHEPDLGSMIEELLGLRHGFALKKGRGVKLTVRLSELHGVARFKWLASGGKLVTSLAEAGG